MDQKKIGIFLKKLRKENCLTQEALAEKLMISARTISRWETGRNMPDISMLVELSEFYQVSIPEIIDGERKSEKMNQETKDTVKKIAEYSTHKVKIEKLKLLSFMFFIVGVCITISAFAIFPNDSSWGSIYAGLGGILIIIGVYLGTSGISMKIQFRIFSILGSIILLFGIFTVSDYISVTQFHQVPRFSYCKSYGEDAIEHTTLFYTVLQKNPGTKDEQIEIIK